MLLLSWKISCYIRLSQSAPERLSSNYKKNDLLKVFTQKSYFIHHSVYLFQNYLRMITTHAYTTKSLKNSFWILCFVLQIYHSNRQIFQKLHKCCKVKEVSC